MRSIFAKRLNKYLIFFIIIAVFLIKLDTLSVMKAYALRITRPNTFQLPWTEEQVNDLNFTLEQLSLMQQGRFEHDIETTKKSNARNGELWYINTGGVVRIQIKAQDHVFTLTPDGF